MAGTINAESCQSATDICQQWNWRMVVIFVVGPRLQGKAPLVARSTGDCYAASDRRRLSARGAPTDRGCFYPRVFVGDDLNTPGRMGR